METTAPEREPRSLRRAFVWTLLLVLAVFSFAVGVFTMPVTDRDEARFAQASRQMAVSGDFIDIRLQTEVRYKKPAGIYWAQAAALRAFRAGENSPIWIHRLPSQIAAVLAVLLIGWAGRPLVGAGPSLLAGAMLASLFLMHTEARIAKTDAALLVASLTAMGALARAWMDEVTGWTVPLIFWTAVAAGLLIKGPVVLAPVGGAILWIAIFRREIAWVGALKPIHGMIWTILLAAPWFVAITIQSGWAFWNESFLTDFAGKLATGQEQHGAPPGAHAAFFLLMFWPWTVFVPMAVVLAWQTRKNDATLFLVGWVLPFWVVLEAVATKLPHYPLPIYPGLLLLCAAAILRRSQDERPFRGVAFWLGDILWLIGLGAMVYLLVILPGIMGADGLPLITTLGTAAMVILALGTGVFVWQQRFAPALFGVAITGLVGIWTFFGNAHQALVPMWMSDRMASAIAPMTCFAGPFAVAGNGEPSTIFALGTDTIRTDAPGALAYLAEAPNRAAWISNEALAGLDTPPEPVEAVEGVNQVTGFNYNGGGPRQMRLYVSPGVQAPAEPCAASE